MPQSHRRYGPHIAAIVMLIVMVGVKAPLMYDLMVLYQSQKRHVLFACILADVVFLFWLRPSLKTLHSFI